MPCFFRVISLRPTVVGKKIENSELLFQPTKRFKIKSTCEKKLILRIRRHRYHIVAGLVVGIKRRNVSPSDVVRPHLDGAVFQRHQQGPAVRPHRPGAQKEQTVHRQSARGHAGRGHNHHRHFPRPCGRREEFRTGRHGRHRGFTDAHRLAHHRRAGLASVRNCLGGL